MPLKLTDDKTLPTLFHVRIHTCHSGNGCDNPPTPTLFRSASKVHSVLIQCCVPIIGSSLKKHFVLTTLSLRFIRKRHRHISFRLISTINLSKIKVKPDISLISFQPDISLISFQKFNLPKYLPIIDFLLTNGSFQKRESSEFSLLSPRTK